VSKKRLKQGALSLLRKAEGGKVGNAKGLYGKIYARWKQLQDTMLHEDPTRRPAAQDLPALREERDRLVEKLNELRANDEYGDNDYSEGGEVDPRGELKSKEWYENYGAGPEYNFFGTRQIPGLDGFSPQHDAATPLPSSGGGTSLGDIIPLIGLGAGIGSDLYDSYQARPGTGPGGAGAVDVSGTQANNEADLSGFYTTQPQANFDTNYPDWMREVDRGAADTSDTNAWIDQELGGMQMPEIDPSMWENIKQGGAGALDLYLGSQQGGLGGAGSMLTGAGDLADVAGFDTAGNYLGTAGDTLGGLSDVYSGIQQGGAEGYLQAGAGALNAADALGYDNALTSAAGDYIPIAGNLYNIGSAFEGGIDSGAEAGSVVNSGAGLMASAAGAGPVGALFAAAVMGLQALPGSSRYSQGPSTDYMGNVPPGASLVRTEDDGTQVYEQQVQYNRGSSREPEMGTYTQTTRIPPIDPRVNQRISAAGLDPSNVSEQDRRMLNLAYSPNSNWTEDSINSYLEYLKNPMVLDEDSIKGLNLVMDFQEGGRVSTQMKGKPMNPQRGGLSQAASMARLSPLDSPQSYYRYGQQAAQPQQRPMIQQPGNPVMAMPQVSRAMGGGLHMGYNAGGAPGATRLVKGPGTGRSDDIPARLSDGEYVFDSETVALLGDGSTDEGARRLDALRKKLRMHKGKKLSKGKFSEKARTPEGYLE